MIDKLLSIAAGEVGYLEKESTESLEDKIDNAGDDNYTKYGAWYASMFGAPSFVGTYWCHMFVSWCASRAGINSNTIPYTASCTTGVSWFRQRGLWHDRDGYTPRRGDIIYFGNADHVGIVYAADAGRVYTIEGNTSGGGSTLVANGGSVAQKSYDRGYSKIMGYGSPMYESEDDMATVIEQIAESAGLSTEETIKALGLVVTLANKKIDAWEPEGVEYLKNSGLINTDRDPREPVEFSELGLILKRAGIKTIV